MQRSRSENVAQAQKNLVGEANDMGISRADLILQQQAMIQHEIALQRTTSQNAPNPALMRSLNSQQANATIVSRFAAPSQVAFQEADFERAHNISQMSQPDHVDQV